MNNPQRRTFMKGVVAGAVLTATAGAGLLRPGPAVAADWPKDAFAARDVETALASLHGSAQSTVSGAIKIKAPLQAENGAAVPISVSTDLPNVETISILVNKNVQPLIASARFTGIAGYLSARVKMSETSDVLAVVKAGGKLYTAKQNIKVTVGGCGG